jgi:hypothetical protein
MFVREVRSRYLIKSRESPRVDLLKMPEASLREYELTVAGVTQLAPYFAVTTPLSVKYQGTCIAKKKALMLLIRAFRGFFAQKKLLDCP